MGLFQRPKTTGPRMRSARFHDEQGLFLFLRMSVLKAQPLSIASGASPLPAGLNLNSQDGIPIPRCQKATLQKSAGAFADSTDLLLQCPRYHRWKPFLRHSECAKTRQQTSGMS